MSAELLNILSANRHLQTDQECLLFTQTLYLIDINQADSSLLPQLYACFDDQAKDIAPMWELIHKVEAYEEEASISALIAQNTLLTQQAPCWLTILWARILNSVQARTRLAQEILPMLPDASSLKSTLCLLFGTDPVRRSLVEQLFL